MPLRQHVVRFIPAGAGNTPLAHPPLVRRPVYPRWRGEHVPAAWRRGRHPGLSPLARGTRSCSMAARQASRFIPAGAGNTFLQHGGAAGIPVYPRWRGEHVPAAWRRGRHPGLSPLARGTRSCSMAARQASRFIPAGAGNTGATNSQILGLTVYPRWRGEHETEASTIAVNAGLSPLARGTHR